MLREQNSFLFGFIRFRPNIICRWLGSFETIICLRTSWPMQKLDLINHDLELNAELESGDVKYCTSLQKRGNEKDQKYPFIFATY